MRACIPTIAFAIALVHSGGMPRNGCAATKPDSDSSYIERLGELVNQYREQLGARPLGVESELSALDRDGQVGEKEWILARAQARREVRKTHNEIRTQSGTHMLHQPRDGPLFLISNVNAEELVLRYRLWSWLHLAVLIGAIAGTAHFGMK